MEQNHSGSGDNVAGNKNIKNFISINTIWMGVGVIFLGLSIWLVPKLIPESTPLTGYVVSNADVPVAGATVTINTPDQQSYKTFSDEDGVFTFDQIDVKKIEQFQISATLKERSIKTDFKDFNFDSTNVIIQLPAGLPPFEVSYYDIKGIDLNFLFDGKVGKNFEKKLGGQPYIIPNTIYQNFKDLGERFNKGHGSNSGGRISGSSLGSQILPEDGGWTKSLTGTADEDATSENYVSVGQSMEQMKIIIGKINSWKKYSKNRKSLEAVNDITKMDSLLEKMINANAEKDYDKFHKSFSQFNDHIAFFTKEEMFILDEYPMYGNGEDGLLKYLIRENAPKDFMKLAFGALCGGDFAFEMIISFPTYYLKVAVIENITNNPIALDSFYIKENSGSLLRTEENESEKTELIVKKLFPKKMIKPGDKLLIPTAIIFTKKNPFSLTNEDSELNYYYGPTWTIEDVKVEGQKFAFREKDSELVVLHSGWYIGSCPYAYTYSEKHKDWLLEDHILFGHNDKRKIGYDEIPLRRFNGELIIKELDPETSFIDLIDIRVESEDGQSQYLKSNISKLQKQDNVFYKMDQGDEFKMSFPEYSSDMKGMFYLRSYGYYEPYEMKQESTGK